MFIIPRREEYVLFFPSRNEIHSVSDGRLAIDVLRRSIMRTVHVLSYNYVYGLHLYSYYLVLDKTIAAQ